MIFRLKKKRPRGREHIDLANQHFGLFKVIKRDWQRSSHAYAYWICQCFCGRREIKRSDVLRKLLVLRCFTCREEAKQKAMRKKWGLNPPKVAKKRTKIIKIKTTQELLQVFMSGFYNESERSIIKMRDELNMKLSEIAQELGLTVEKVQEILREARKKQKAELPD